MKSRNTMIKSVGRVLAAIAVGVSLAGCNDFFDLQPTNEMVLDDFWKSEDDVKSVTSSCYRNMQESDFLKRVIVWGEFRSDNMLLSPSNGDDNLRYIANLNLLPSNGYTSWGNFYNVINLCNTVEHFAPGVRDEDSNFTQSQLNAYLAEVKGIRAYCYFTLVRAFRDVPFVTEPVIDDTDTFEAPQAAPDHIIDFLIDDLKAVEPRAAATYSNKTYTKSRMTQAAIRALIADMCLWRGRYSECIEYCNRILRDANNVFTLVPSMSYSREVFTTGLSSETIFELNYNTVNYWNYAVADFYGEQSQGYAQQIIPYDFKTGVRQLFGETDLRERTSYYSNSGGGAIIRKYVSYLEGTALTASNVSSGDYTRVSPYETKWIVYRLPEIYLMKAEAIVESGGDLQEAFRLACISYDRANPEAGAGSLSFDNYNSTELMLNFIYDERQREFLYEGKRYFDLLRRITHHRDQFRNLVSTYLAVKYDNLDQSTVSSKLSSYDALYMPINATEMRANSLLVQNPFYKQSTDITN